MLSYYNYRFTEMSLSVLAPKFFLFLLLQEVDIFQNQDISSSVSKIDRKRDLNSIFHIYQIFNTSKGHKLNKFELNIDQYYDKHKR